MHKEYTILQSQREISKAKKTLYQNLDRHATKSKLKVRTRLGNEGYVVPYNKKEDFWWFTKKSEKDLDAGLQRYWNIFGVEPNWDSNNNI